MSTMSLTVLVTILAVVKLLSETAKRLWQHDLPGCLVYGGLTCAVAHMVLVALGWMGTSPYALDVLGGLYWLADPVSDFPTWAFDAPAWAAIVLIVAGGALKTLDRVKAKKA